MGGALLTLVAVVLLVAGLWLALYGVVIGGLVLGIAWLFLRRRRASG
jgi:hypothetical protein